MSVAADTKPAEQAAQVSTTSNDHKTASRKRINELVAKGTEHHAQENKKVAADDEDDKFAQTVRRLLSELKSIIEIAKQKMQLENGSSSNEDVAQAEKALRATEQALADISVGTISIDVSVSITV